MDMVEKVAKAIYEADDPWSGAFEWPEMGSPEQSAENYRLIARAAIEAMRDPTWEMMKASYEAMFEGKWDGIQAVMIGAGFDAAIDAALKPLPL